MRRDLLDRFDLEPHELVLLDSACRTADVIADLQAVVDRDGPMVDGKPNPAAVEARMQRLTLGRLLAGLRIPVEDDRSHQPHRGPRGWYGPRAVS
ncbi:MAG: hypothetical protein H0U47_00170 [Nocardioidaceae bacterium]|nr:hypothetical protein [Nocardioidaceae bacterium]